MNKSDIENYKKFMWSIHLAPKGYWTPSTSIKYAFRIILTKWRTLYFGRDPWQPKKHQFSWQRKGTHRTQTLVGIKQFPIHDDIPFIKAIYLCFTTQTTNKIINLSRGDDMADPNYQKLIK